jgi:hypothetical protein
LDSAGLIEALAVLRQPSWQKKDLIPVTGVTGKHKIHSFPQFFFADGSFK